MSTKLPIGDTINEAFHFGLHRWGAVVRYGWLPVVVSMVVFVVTMLAIFDFAAFPALETEMALTKEMASFLRVPVPVAATVGIAAYVFVVFLFSGVLASIYRLAALGEDRPGVFQLRLDGTAKRVFFALVILVLINLTISFVSVAAGLAITGASTTDFLAVFRQFVEFTFYAESGSNINIFARDALSPAITACGYAAIIQAVLAFYVYIKLVPFVAGSAAENRLWLIGSFVKTTGHFWSILGIMILFILLIIAASIIFGIAIVIAQLIATILASQGGALAIMSVILFLAVFPAMIWFMAFFTAMQFGLEAIIYRRLKTGA